MGNPAHAVMYGDRERTNERTNTRLLGDTRHTTHFTRHRRPGPYVTLSLCAHTLPKKRTRDAPRAGTVSTSLHLTPPTSICALRPPVFTSAVRVLMALCAPAGWVMQVLLRPPGHSLGSQRVRVHRDVSLHPRSSRFAPPSRISGSKRTAERRKVARRQLPLTTRAPGWLALGSSLRQQGGRRVQIDRRAVKVWRVLGGGTAPVSH